MLKRKIMIATPAYDEPCTDWTKSLISTMELFGRADIEVHVCIIGGLCYVHTARNHICDAFLRSPCDELIKIDSDIGWNPEELLQLCCIERNVIGAAAPYRKAEGGFPVVFKQDGEGHYVGSYLPNSDAALLECTVLATAMLRIQRGVFGKLVEANEAPRLLDGGQDKYGEKRMVRRFFNFETEEKYDGKNDESYLIEYGEDVTFCRKLQRAGIGIWCDPRLSLRHHGKQYFEGRLHDRLMEGRPEAPVDVMKAKANGQLTAGFPGSAEAAVSAEAV